MTLVWDNFQLEILIKQIIVLDVEEFVFSSWYFLIFYIINSSLEANSDVSLSSSEILTILSNKLSVPAPTFIINDIHKVGRWMLEIKIRA